MGFAGGHFHLKAQVAQMFFNATFELLAMLQCAGWMKRLQACLLK